MFLDVKISLRLFRVLSGMKQTGRNPLKSAACKVCAQDYRAAVLQQVFESEIVIKYGC
jgi:hypothetical protein